MAVIDRTATGAEGEKYAHKSWPAWRYGPEGKSEIFEREEDVPDGYEDHPSKVGGSKEPKQERQPAVDSPYKGKTDAEIVESLKSRNIDFNAKWPRHKLEALLIEADKKA